ncbi:pyruvate kinase [Candidatus Gracilibacteria bacterium HOT-871]|nr:pyruvate kinase [Candidatus Gracilibacteria bacterium HOT-871]
MKKTKIITTLGPSTDSKEKIEALYKKGANVVRLNYSHTDYEYFGKIIDNVQALNAEGKTNFAILTDTKGPEIRTKAIDEKIKIEEGEEFFLSNTKNEQKVADKSKKMIVCDYDYIISDLEVGSLVDIDTGLLKAEVMAKDDSKLVCRAKNAHLVGSKRHLNLPGTILKLPGITESDKKDIEFAVGKGTDFIALSFVRNKENIIELKEYLKEINAPKGIQIISKIENREALNNIDDIIEYSHGIMIARGDLGAEVDFETLPILQKNIAEKCKKAGKFFIIATQMLETMIENPIPTRAEVTDIYNAVVLEADCTMLSGETAAGKYPIEAVDTMAKVLRYTESQIFYDHHHFDVNSGDEDEMKKQLVKSAIYTAERINAKNIIVFSLHMTKLIAAFRSNINTFSFTFSDSVRKKMVILFGTKTFQIEKKSNEENLNYAIKLLKEKGLLNLGDKIVAITEIEKQEQIVPSMQIIEIK